METPQLLDLVWEPKYSRCYEAQYVIYSDGVKSNFELFWYTDNQKIIFWSKYVLNAQQEKVFTDSGFSPINSLLEDIRKSHKKSI